MIKDFESSMEKLETIVKSLEDGSLPLEDALKRFEEGINLSSQCQKILSHAEQKIKVLTEKGLEDFNATEN